MSSHPKTSLNEYPYPESSNMSIFNNLSGTYIYLTKHFQQIYGICVYKYNMRYLQNIFLDIRYTDYWNRARTSEDMWPNHMTTYSQILSPLDVLSRVITFSLLLIITICFFCFFFNSIFFIYIRKNLR